MPKVVLELDVQDVVVITENHGGYLTGKCVGCKADGWLGDTGYGYPARSRRKGAGYHLKHKASCPMNDILNNDGSLNVPGCRGG